MNEKCSCSYIRFNTHVIRTNNHPNIAYYVKKKFESPQIFHVGRSSSLPAMPRWDFPPFVIAGCCNNYTTFLFFLSFLKLLKKYFKTQIQWIWPSIDYNYYSTCIRVWKSVGLLLINCEVTIHCKNANINVEIMVYTIRICIYRSIF